MLMDFRYTMMVLVPSYGKGDLFLGMSIIILAILYAFIVFVCDEML